jgi:hypothetical protein
MRNEHTAWIVVRITFSGSKRVQLLPHGSRKLKLVIFTLRLVVAKNEGSFFSPVLNFPFTLKLLKLTMMAIAMRT